jgi:hypothetical protein
MKQVFADCQKLDVAHALDPNLRGASPQCCLGWVLEASPEVLCILAIMALDNDTHDHATEFIREFWKFMRGPGTEVLLTEAAYRGYAPAMSILSSFYENSGRTTEARFWRKVGVAHANPTALLLRGLEFMVEGKLEDNNSLTERGRNLVIFSFAFGEEIACETPGFEALASSNKPPILDQNEILDIIFKTEGFEKSRSLQFVQNVVNETNQGVSISRLISHIQRANDMLDDPQVSVFEINVLFRIRKALAKEIVHALEARPDSGDALRAFEKAELTWRYQRVKGGDVVIENVVLPIILGN